MENVCQKFLSLLKLLLKSETLLLLLLKSEIKSQLETNLNRQSRIPIWGLINFLSLSIVTKVHRVVPTRVFSQVKSPFLQKMVYVGPNRQSSGVPWWNVSGRFSKPFSNNGSRMKKFLVWPVRELLFSFLIPQRSRHESPQK